MIKLSDFGISKKLVQGEKTSEHSGTPAYLAPEVHAKKFYDPVKAEIWSLGICLFNMLVNKLPFQGSNSKELKKAILNGYYQFPTHVRLSSEARELISVLLSPDPRARPNLRSILQHAWFHSGRKVRYNLFDTNFDYRLQINKEVLRAATGLGYVEQQVENAVFSGEICPESAAYYMLL